jgi:hypothetical protein
MTPARDARRLERECDLRRDMGLILGNKGNGKLGAPVAPHGKTGRQSGVPAQASSRGIGLRRMFIAGPE